MATTVVALTLALFLDTVQSVGVIFACTAVAGVIYNVWLQLLQTQCATRMKFNDFSLGDLAKQGVSRTEPSHKQSCFRATTATLSRPKSNKSKLELSIPPSTAVPIGPRPTFLCERSTPPLGRSSTVYSSPRITSGVTSRTVLQHGNRAYVDPISAVWCRSASPSEAMAHGLAILRFSCSIATVRSVLAERLVPADFRFTCCLKVDLWGRWYWGPQMFFQIENHVMEYRRELTDATSEEFISSLLVTHPNMDIPPWRVIVCNKYRLGNGRYTTALILRFHHALTDGFSLLQCILKSFESAHQPTSKRSFPSKLSNAKSNCSVHSYQSTSCHSASKSRQFVSNDRESNGCSVEQFCSSALSNSFFRRSRSPTSLSPSDLLPFRYNSRRSCTFAAVGKSPTSPEFLSPCPTELKLLSTSSHSFRCKLDKHLVTDGDSTRTSTSHSSNVAKVFDTAPTKQRSRVASLSESTTCEMQSECGSSCELSDDENEMYEENRILMCTQSSGPPKSMKIQLSFEDEHHHIVHSITGCKATIVHYMAHILLSIWTSIGYSVSFLWAVLSLGYRLSVSPADGVSLFKGNSPTDHKHQKTTAWRELSTSIRDVRIISKRLGISTTEIIVTVISGGLREYRSQVAASIPLRSTDGCRNRETLDNSQNSKSGDSTDNDTNKAAVERWLTEKHDLFASEDYRAIIWASIHPSIRLHSNRETEEQKHGVLGNLGLGGTIITIPTADHHYINHRHHDRIKIQKAEDERKTEHGDKMTEKEKRDGQPKVNVSSINFCISILWKCLGFGTKQTEFDVVEQSDLTRLRARLVHQRLQTSRHNKEPFAMNLFFRALSWFPTRKLFLYFWRLVSGKVTVSISNLSAAAVSRLYIGNSQIEKLVFFSPPQAKMGVAFGSMCYNNTINISVAVNNDMLDIVGCRRLLELIDHSMIDLRRCVLQ